MSLYRKYSGGRSIVKVAPLFFNLQCARVKGRRCMEDDECACVNRHNRTLICNWQKRCERSGFIDDIMRSQPVRVWICLFCAYINLYSFGWARRMGQRVPFAPFPYILLCIYRF